MENDKSAQIPASLFTTHIHRLVEQVARAPFTIAPEKRDLTLAIVKKHASMLQIQDGPETKFKCDTLFGHVFTSIRTMQHFWTAACFYACLYCEKLRAVERGETEITISYNPNIEKACAFYCMSCEAFKEDKELPWPDKIEEVTPDAEALALADEIFLLMWGFSLLHEIAHIEMGDTKIEDSTGDNREQTDPHAVELAADKWAYDWILSSWKELSPNPKIFIKRTLGIIFALTMTDEFHYLFPKDSIQSSHPRAVSRLIQFYNDYAKEIEENEWSATCFSAVTLGLQMVAINNKCPLPQGPYEGIRDFLEKAKSLQLSS